MHTVAILGLLGIFVDGKIGRVQADMPSCIVHPPTEVGTATRNTALISSMCRVVLI